MKGHMYSNQKLMHLSNIGL